MERQSFGDIFYNDTCVYMRVLSSLAYHLTQEQL